MNRTKRGKKLDLETLLIIFTISIMEAVGVIVFISSVTGINFFEAGVSGILGMFVGMSGIIFAILSILNTK
ncbi:MAG: hypothetical protein UH211_02260 [Agathobacter sp.]|nr:hypothetical protein [Agathobacter sp.]